MQRMCVRREQQYDALYTPAARRHTANATRAAPAVGRALLERREGPAHARTRPRAGDPARRAEIPGKDRDQLVRILRRDRCAPVRRGGLTYASFRHNQGTASETGASARASAIPSAASRRKTGDTRERRLFPLHTRYPLPGRSPLRFRSVTTTVPCFPGGRPAQTVCSDPVTARRAGT